MQNIKAVNMTKEKIEGIFDCTCACFFVVERITDEDFIKNIAKRLIGDGCRSFTFFGKHRFLWENVFDDIDIEINPEWEDEDNVSLTKTNQHIELFADGIIGEFKPNGYVFYDDEAVCKEVLLLVEKDNEDETKRYLLNDNCIRDMFFKICKEFETNYPDFDVSEFLSTGLYGDFIQCYTKGDKTATIIWNPSDEWIEGYANFDLTRFAENMMKLKEEDLSQEKYNICRCCLKAIVGFYEICPVCGFEADGLIM